MPIRALAIMLALALVARGASPQIAFINPPGGQWGSELEIEINGQHLADAAGILFYSPGIDVIQVKPVGEGKMTARLRIAPNCLLGEHPLRVVTQTGISDLRRFYVGPFPNVAEIKPNNTPLKAQVIPLNCTVNGVILEEQIAYFAVQVKQGQRVTAEVEGMRLGTAMFDPLLEVRNKDGKLLARNDDNSLLQQDPLVSFVAPADDTCLVALRESAWGGSEKCHFRLHVGTFPQPLVAYPPGGQAGQPLAVQLIGDTLGAIPMPIQLPTVASPLFQIFAAQGGLTAPAANLIRVSPFPSFLEVRPNDDKARATMANVPPPLAFNGIVSQKGGAGFFKFKAAKGDQLDLNVYARRLRSPLDSVLTLWGPKGNFIASNDDNEGPDSYLRFKAAEDGNYCISVRDQSGRGGPTFVYRVEITPVSPAVTLSIPEIVKYSQERQSVVIPRGNRYATVFRAQRADLDGSLTLQPSELPAGVSCTVGAPAGDLIPVIFEASADAPLASERCALNLKAGEGGKAFADCYRQDVELVIAEPNNTTYVKSQVDKLAVSVAAEAPFSLDLQPPKLPLTQGGAMEIKVTATRRPDFRGPITVSLLNNPPGVGSQSAVTIPEGQTQASIPISATNQAKARAWKIAAIGSEDDGKGTVWVSSAFAELNVSKPFVSASIQSSATVQGSPATVVCALAQNTSFLDKATVRLMGLPNKASAPDIEITPADHEIRFAVTTDPKTPVGKCRNLFCEFTFKKEGEKTTEDSGQGGVLRIDPRPDRKAIAAK